MNPPAQTKSESKSVELQLAPNSHASSLKANEGLRELEVFDAAADHFLIACEERFSRVVGHNSISVSCASCVTHFVIPGREFVLSDNPGSLTFWVGLNGGRIFFISRYVGKAEALKEVFRFSLGGAQKIGWDFNYEPVLDCDVDETSIWGTVDTGTKLTEKRSTPRREDESADLLTDSGCFWVNDIAMMLQSMLRTSQRNNIKNGHQSPAPL